MYTGPAFYNLENGVYVRQETMGWVEGTGTQTFTAGQYQYLTLNSKYDTAGSTYPNPPSELTVVFE